MWSMDVLPIPPPFIVLGLVVLALVVILCRADRRGSRRILPYSKRPSLLTPAEMRFYRALLQAILPAWRCALRCGSWTW
jgi:hypothetical protein